MFLTGNGDNARGATPLETPRTARKNSFRGIEAFVPETVIRTVYKSQFLDLKVPFSEEFYTVVMFADISGFTPLSERLAASGDRGSEDLAFVLNRYLQSLMRLISKTGGDVVKFAGDAICCLWPSLENGEEPSREELVEMTSRAVQCAFRLQQELNDFSAEVDMAKLEEEEASLNVKVGIGVGLVSVMYVGGIHGRLEYVPVGPPLVQAFGAEAACNSGESCVSDQVYQMAKGKFDFQKVEKPSADGQQYWRIAGLGDSVKNVKFKRIPLDGTIHNQLGDYVPAAVLPYLDMSVMAQQVWAGELRRMSVMFVNLDLKLSCTSEVTDDVLQRVHSAIKLVQKSIYKYEGSLNKFLVDDKGSTLVAVFGLPPLAHERDPARGLLSALQMIEALKHIQLHISVGVTSGTALCGLIGSSGNRREYTVLGDVVNLAARLMQKAGLMIRERRKAVRRATLDDDKLKFFRGVICDKPTYEACKTQTMLEFYPLGPCQVKGKACDVEMFLPRRKPSVFGQDNFQLAKCDCPGTRKEILALNKTVETMVDTGRGSAEFLSAELGAGKTHILRHVYYNAAESESAVVMWTRGSCFSTEPHFYWRMVFRWAAVLGPFGQDSGDATPRYEDEAALQSIAQAVDHARSGSPTPSSPERHPNLNLDPQTPRSTTKHSSASKQSARSGYGGTPRTPRMRMSACPSVVHRLMNTSWHDHRMSVLTRGSNYSLYASEMKWIEKLVKESRPELVDYLFTLNDILDVTYKCEVEAPLHDVLVAMRVELIVFVLKALVGPLPLLLLLDDCHWMQTDDWETTAGVCRKIADGEVEDISLFMGSRPLEDRRYKPTFTRAPDAYFFIKRLLSDQNAVKLIGNFDNEQDIKGCRREIENRVLWQYRRTNKTSNAVDTVAPPVIDLVYERTNGRPLFMLRFVEDLLGNDRFEINERELCFKKDFLPLSVQADSEFPVPDRVQRITAGMLDRLENEWSLALKIASVICLAQGCGSNTFSLAMVDYMHPIPEFRPRLYQAILALEHFHLITRVDGWRAPNDPCLAKDIDTLENIEAKIINRQQNCIKSFLARARYRFEYGFLKDVVYQQMLYKQREKLRRNAIQYYDDRLKQTEDDIGGCLYDDEISDIMRIRRRLIDLASRNSDAVPHPQASGVVTSRADDGVEFTSGVGRDSMVNRPRGKLSRFFSCCQAEIEEPFVDANYVAGAKGSMVRISRRRPSVNWSESTSVEDNRVHVLPFDHIEDEEEVDEPAAPSSIPVLSADELDKFNGLQLDLGLCVEREAKILANVYPLTLDIALAMIRDHERDANAVERTECQRLLRLVENAEDTADVVPEVLTSQFVKEVYESRREIMSDADVHYDCAVQIKMNPRFVRRVRTVCHNAARMRRGERVPSLALDMLEQKHEEKRSSKVLIVSSPRGAKSDSADPLEETPRLSLSERASDSIRSTLTFTENDQRKSKSRIGGRSVVRPLPLSIGRLSLTPPLDKPAERNSLSRTASKLKTAVTAALSPVARHTPSTFLVTNYLTKALPAPIDDAIRNCLENLDSWGFDAFNLYDVSGGAPLLYVGYSLFHRFDLFNKCSVEEQTLVNFLMSIERGYNLTNNPYHNSIHAADVAQTVCVLLTRLDLVKSLSSYDILAIIVATLIHDYRHPGLNNLFLRKVGDLRAIMFESQVLESFHCTAAFRMLCEEQNNILKNVPTDVLPKLRRKIMNLVLATNIEKHMNFLEEVRELFANADTTHEDRLRWLVKMCIKCSDISNSAKPFEIYRPWANLIMDEFYMQGDLESKLPDMEVTRFYDRNVNEKAECQRGFITFLVRPLFAELATQYPQVNDFALANLDHNVEKIKVIEHDKSSSAF